MTNFEKYKTAKERADVFRCFCENHASNGCSECDLKDHTCSDTYPMECFAYWLDLEAEKENPLPCPFCGSEVKVGEIDNEKKEAVEFYIHCEGCHITTMDFATREELLSMWNNRVVKAVMDAKNKETGNV